MKYTIINETHYHSETPIQVIEVLEKCRLNNTRIVLDYGDRKTGKSWNEEYGIKGRIGRSTGTGNIKIPILIYNSRSIGGVGILTDCIIGIKESKGGKSLYNIKIN